MALKNPYGITYEPSYQDSDNVLVVEKEQFDSQSQRNYSMWVKKPDKTSMKFLTGRSLLVGPIPKVSFVIVIHEDTEIPEGFLLIGLEYILTGSHNLIQNNSFHVHFLETD